MSAEVVFLKVNWFQNTKCNFFATVCSLRSLTNNLVPNFQATAGLTESVLAENDTTASIRGSDLVRQKLEHGKVWEGPLSCRRKAGDSLVLDTRIIPISFSAKRVPENLIYVKMPPPNLIDDASTCSVASVHHRRSSKTGITVTTPGNMGSKESNMSQEGIYETL